MQRSPDHGKDHLAQGMHNELFDSEKSQQATHVRISTFKPITHVCEHPGIQGTMRELLTPDKEPEPNPCSVSLQHLPLAKAKIQLVLPIDDSANSQTLHITF